jgi:protein phosphatase PTC2/3
MDMDQRTRMLGRGNGGRIILLGDGTEIHTGHDDDGDVDMEDRGEAEELEDKDLEEQVQKGQADAKQETNGPVKERGGREETPGPDSQQANTASSSEATSTVEEVKPEMSPQQSRTEPGSSATPDEPKMAAPVDGADNKKLGEELQSSK